MALVIPLLLNMTQVGNNHPVSLHTVLSKAIERVVLKQIIKFLSWNSLPYLSQSFKTGHSTETTFSSVTKELKAVNYRIMDITGSAHSCLTLTYLDICSWCRGVHQGSMLGPLLFAINTTSPIIQMHESSCHCYTDDK